MAVISLQSTSLYVTPVWLRTKWNILRVLSGKFLAFLQESDLLLAPKLPLCSLFISLFSLVNMKCRWN